MLNWNNRWLASLLFLGFTAFAPHSGSAEGYGYCLVCHGSAAGGNQAIGGPNLTVLSPRYLQAQLEGFSNGYRGSHPDDHLGKSMVSAARMLGTAAQREEVIEFIAGYPKVLSASTVSGDAEKGKVLYASCAGCHGASGEGNEQLRAPVLAGQSDWYLTKQLRDYRDGRRGGHADDTYGNIMRAAVADLVDDASIDDLASYIQVAFGAQDTPESGSDALVQDPTKNAGTATYMGERSMQGILVKSGSKKVVPAMALAIATTAAATGALSHDVTRYPLPNGSSFPIAQAVTVPAGTELTFHSGLLPAPADPDAAPGTREYLGDTYTQTMSVLQQFDASLKAKGMGLGNIIKMNVFLVGDPEMEGKMDFAGFMRAYSQFFGTEEQPHLPARAAVQIVGLARGAFIEIEVIAAR